MSVDDKVDNIVRGIVNALLNGWAIFCIISTIVLPITILLAFIPAELAGPEKLPPMSLTKAMLVFVGGGQVLFLFLSLMLGIMEVVFTGNSSPHLSDDIDWRTFNPLSFYFYHLPKGIYRLYKGDSKRVRS